MQHSGKPWPLPHRHPCCLAQCPLNTGERRLASKAGNDPACMSAVHTSLALRQRLLSNQHVHYPPLRSLPSYSLPLMPHSLPLLLCRSYPPHINSTRAAELREEARERMPYGGSESYRFMCR